MWDSNTVSKIYEQIQKLRQPIMKQDRIYVPLIHSWDQISEEVVGVMLLNLKSAPSKTSNTSSKISFQTSLLVKEVFQNMRYMFNLCILQTLSNRHLHYMDLISSLGNQSFNSYTTQLLDTKIISLSFYFFNILVDKFNYDLDINQSLRLLRIYVSDISGFEDCGILIEDPNKKIANLYALSPNLSYDFIKNNTNCDLFYFSNVKSISQQVLITGQKQMLEWPANNNFYDQNLDNLSPIQNPRVVVYIPILDSSGKVYGLVQYINKKVNRKIDNLEEVSSI